MELVKVSFLQPKQDLFNAQPSRSSKRHANQERSMTLTVDTLITLAMTRPVNGEITKRLPTLRLDQCRLTAGCLFQAVWNLRSDFPPDWGVHDYDVFYFDEDLSWEAENAVIQQARALFKDMGVNIELRNQARFHLWMWAIVKSIPPLGWKIRITAFSE